MGPDDICVWPDYSWCEYHELEEYMLSAGVSDDYVKLEVPADVGVLWVGIDDWLCCTRPLDAGAQA